MRLENQRFSKQNANMENMLSNTLYVFILEINGM